MTAAAQTRVAISGSRPLRIYHLLRSQTDFISQARCGWWPDGFWTLADATEAGLRCCRHCEGGDGDE